MHQGLHSDQTLSRCMYHIFGIITESDVISSRESTNTFKLVRIGLNEDLIGVQWRSEVMPVLNMFCLGFLGGSQLLVSLTTQFSWAIPNYDEEGRPSMADSGLSATYHLVWRCFECWLPLGAHPVAVSRAPNYGMFDQLYAVSLVLQGWSRVGLPSIVI